MSEIDEISRAIGSLETSVTTLTSAVEALAAKVDGLQQAKWTSKGIILGLAALSGGAGSKIAEIFGVTGGPPSHP